MTQTDIMTFEDRRSAGRLLAEHLRAYAGTDTVVLGITRGGVVVAHEVVRRLHLPLDALVVQRIAEPGERHLGLGAVAEQGHLLVSRRRLRALALSADWLRHAVAESIRDVRRREAALRGARQRREIAGRRVIVVDDSAATGATLRTAVKAVRALGAREIVVAVPVAPPRVLDRLRGQVDHLVCPATPAALIVQGIHYPAPLAMSDDDIRILLEQGSATPDEPTSEGSEVD